MAGLVFFQSEEELHATVRLIVERTYALTKAGNSLKSINRIMIDALVSAIVIDDGKALQNQNRAN